MSSKCGWWKIQLLVLSVTYHICIQDRSVEALSPLHQPNPNSKIQVPTKSLHEQVNRRSVLGTIVSFATGIASTGSIQEALAEPPLKLPLLQSNSSDDSTTTLSAASSKRTNSRTPTFDAYYITPDESNVRSKLDKIDSQQFLQQMASVKNKSGGAVWLGEHHNSAADHDFQATFIREVHKHRQKHFSQKSNGGSNMMAIGLEQVQQEFQPILDAYIDGKISLDRMRFMVQWDKRWTWSFENYQSIFETAKQLRIPLLALNVDSEDLSIVEKEGYPGLPKERLRKYIKDPRGFSEFALEPDFQSYVDYVIQPSYELHQRMGLLRYTMAGERMEEEMTFRRFLSGRILWDEGMASGAFSWCAKNPGGLLIGLVGADHVKFKNGIPGRFSRMASKENLLDCKSVVINPTLIDSRPSGSVASIPTSDLAEYPERITLQLRYVKSSSVNPETGLALERKEGVLPFSDYVVLT